MEDSVCINRTLVSKQRDREQYWGIYRWRGGAKGSFLSGLIGAIANTILLCIFTALLFLDPYAKYEIGYILLCIFCWLYIVFFILLMIFQDRIFARKIGKLRRKMAGSEPSYIVYEFYSDHLTIRIEATGEVVQVPYTAITEYKETENYCILFASGDEAFTYGKEEFVQGSADGAYALIEDFCFHK